MVAEAENSSQPNSVSASSENEYVAPVQRYKEAVLRRFPALHPRVVDNCSMFPVDAIALGSFLEHYPCRVVALEIGAFVGISAFCFACHPKVSKVISVDPNPAISDELVANTDRWEGKIDLGPLKGLKVFDVARATLEEFAQEREKIEFREGVVGTTQVGAKGGTIPGLRKVEVPTANSVEGEGLVALVDGLHTREGVREDLKAVFEKNPHAVALMDDCRYGWGHHVQAGVVEFMEGAAESYRFRLFADIAPGLARSSFGIVYPESIATEIEEVLDRVRGSFRGWPEPSRLRSRVSDLEEQLTQARRRNKRIRSRLHLLQEKNERLEEQKEQLNARYSRRRHKIADAIADRVWRLPGLRHLPGRNRT